MPALPHNLFSPLLTFSGFRFIFQLPFQVPAIFSTTLQGHVSFDQFPPKVSYSRFGKQLAAQVDRHAPFLVPLFLPLLRSALLGFPLTSLLVNFSTDLVVIQAR